MLYKANSIFIVTGVNCVKKMPLTAFDSLTQKHDLS